MDWLHKISGSLLKGKDAQDVEDSTPQYDTVTVHKCGDDDLADHDYSEVELPGPKGKKGRKKSKTKNKPVTTDDGIYECVPGIEATKRETIQDPSGYEIMDHKGGKSREKKKSKSKNDEYDYVRHFVGKKEVKKRPVSIAAVPSEATGGGNYAKLLTKTRDTEKHYDIPEPPKEVKKRPVSNAAVLSETGDGNYAKLLTEKRDTEKHYDIPEPLTHKTSSEKTKAKGSKAPKPKPLKGKAKKKREPEEDPYVNNDYTGPPRASNGASAIDSILQQFTANAGSVPHIDAEKKSPIGSKLQQFTASAKTTSVPGIEAEKSNYENNDYHGVKTKDKKKPKKGRTKTTEAASAKSVPGIEAEESDYENNDYHGAITITKDKKKSKKGGKKLTEAEESDYENNDYHGVKTKPPKKSKKSGTKTTETKEVGHYEDHDYDGKTLDMEESQKEGKPKKKKLKWKGKSNDDEYDYVRDFGGMRKKEVKKRPVSIAAVPPETGDGNYAKLLIQTRDTEKHYAIPEPHKEDEKTKSKKKSKEKAKQNEEEDDHYVNEDYSIESSPSKGKTNRLMQLLKGKGTPTSNEGSAEATKKEDMDSSGYEIMEHGELKKTSSGSKLMDKMKSAKKYKAQRPESTGYDYVRDIGKLIEAKKLLSHSP